MPRGKCLNKVEKGNIETRECQIKKLHNYFDDVTNVLEILLKKGKIMVEK